LQLEGHPEAFVIGDMADVEAGGGHLPMLAAVAIQEAESAARSIRALVRGDRPTPFRYRDKGIMATIGRNAGVAQIGGLHLRGFVGWLAWLGVHLLLILSLRSKLQVLVNWSWDYFFYDRPVRFIMGAGGSASAEHAAPTDDGYGCRGRSFDTWPLDGRLSADGGSQPTVATPPSVEGLTSSVKVASQAGQVTSART
ncbi:MAG: hypothetical protein ACREOS_10350, partial [Candidatus Dormibacteraceae bacterium]